VSKWSNIIEFREISGPHSGVYEDGCLLGCCAVYFDRLPTFQRYLLPPISGR
jgi:hypothetical protein